MKRNKKSALVLSLVLAALSVIQPAAAQEYPEDTAISPDISAVPDSPADEDTAILREVNSDFDAAMDQEEDPELYTGYVEPEEGETVDAVHYGGRENGSFVSGEECVLGGIDEEELPSYYMTKELPPLRNQVEGGPCWSFGLNAAAEIYALKSESMRDDYKVTGYVDNTGKYIASDTVSDDAVNVIYDVDLSEAHSCYFVYNTPLDPLGGIKGDKNGFVTAGKNCFTMGGNFLYAKNVLMGWVGPAVESLVPYSSRSSVVSNGLEESLGYRDIYHMTGCYMVNIVENPELVKKAIIEKGAVNASIYFTSSYHNSSTNSYWCYNKYSTNHAVTLVGWDDTYPAGNFKTHTGTNGEPEGPSKDGAWIVRNSHTESTPFEMSRQGYFYLSYEDTSLLYNKNTSTGRSVYFYDYETVDETENCYQYDGGMVSSKINSGIRLSGVSGRATLYGANVFTSKAGENGEFIDHIAFSTETTNQDYEVYICTGLEENTTDPESGAFAWAGTVAAGSVQYAGYYKVKLDKPVYVKPQDRFSVVVMLRKNDDAGEDEAPDFSIEYNSPDKTAGGITAWSSYSSVCGIEKGESFIYRGGAWQDLSDYLKDDTGAYSVGRSGGNIRIKAYTHAVVSGDSIPLQTLEFDDEDGQVDMEAGQEQELAVLIYPENAEDTGHVFSSTDESVVTVDENGRIKAVGVGKAAIRVMQTSGEGLQDEIRVVVGSQKDTSSSVKTESSSSAKSDTSSSVKTESSSSAKTETSSSAKSDSSSSAKSDGSGSIKTISEDVVVKQKLDLSSYFSSDYRKYKVIPASFAKMSRKKLLTAKKPGNVLIEGLKKVGGKWVADEIYSLKIEKPVVIEKRITVPEPGKVIEGKDNITGSSIAPTKWVSSKPEVAFVDAATGRITVGNLKGTTTITAYYGEGKYSAKLKFKVKNR